MSSLVSRVEYVPHSYFFLLRRSIINYLIDLVENKGGSDPLIMIRVLHNDIIQTNLIMGWC